MFRKQIGHFVMVSLKYFFDLDPSIGSHVLVIILLAPGFLRLWAAKSGRYIQVGINNVKEDMFELKAGVNNIKERWGNSTLGSWRLK